MAPLSKDNGGSSARRKSFNLLNRATPSLLPQINTDVGGMSTEEMEKREKKRKAKRRSSIFGIGSLPSPDGHESSMSPSKSAVSQTLDSPRLRPKTLQKNRPSSIFSSLGRRSTVYLEGDEDKIATGTPISPAGSSADMATNSGASRQVLYHGEIQTTSGMFRKKKEYLVLTETHLVRFKSQARAAETYSSISSQLGRTHTSRHPSSASIGSLQEVQSTGSHTSADNEHKIPLQQIVTVYKVEDGRPYFTLEVVYLEEEYHGAGSIQLILQDPKEADLWHTCIRGAATKARLLMVEPYPQRVIRYLVAALEAANDYDPSTFNVFRIVRRVSAYKGLRAGQDDFQKVANSVFYLVVGINLAHLIPLPEFEKAGKELLSPKKSRLSFGIVTLQNIRVNYEDDRFELEFRLPMSQAEVLELACAANPDIAYVLINRMHQLKPLWLDTTYNFNGPRALASADDLPHGFDEDFGCFERTLTAFLVAYNCNPANIQYSIDFEVEDAPEFRLLSSKSRRKYTALELLAVFRALRYNSTFHSISFRGRSLHSLHSSFDPFGCEHVAISSRDGLILQPLKDDLKANPKGKSLLHWEVQALVLKSDHIFKFDFSDCLPQRKPKELDVEGDFKESDKDPGCQLIAPLMPILGYNNFVSVTWLALNGIELSDTDFDYLLTHLSKPTSAFRAVEMSRCKLDDSMIMPVCRYLIQQHATLEHINLSDNPGRVDLESFADNMSHFSKLRTINLSKTFWTRSQKPMFILSAMLTWPLEELHLDGISINAATVEVLTDYLASSASDNLRVLHLNQCNLSGTDVAGLMHAMTRRPGEIRDIELHVDSNRLERGINEIINAVTLQHAPMKFYLRMIEFEKEDHFRQLLRALRSNKTIRTLDISKASLPQDANDETCEELKLLFQENTTLEIFNISGELSHLETTRFGIGLTYALSGLLQNTALQSLTIEFQELGSQGADALASVIEENTGLRRIFCEHNEITLQGFTSIVNALAKNYQLLELPFKKFDGFNALRQMNTQILQSREPTGSMFASDNSPKRQSTIRQKLTGLTTRAPKKQKSDITPQDLEAIAKVLGEKWEFQLQRLEKLLDRNRKIDAKLPGYLTMSEADAMMEKEALRPTTAVSEQTLLEQVRSNTTPRVEASNPVEEYLFSNSPPDVAGKSVRWAADQVDSESGSEPISPKNSQDLGDNRLVDKNTKVDRTTLGKLEGDMAGMDLKDLDSSRGSDELDADKELRPTPSLPELRLPSMENEKLFELGESDRAIFAGLES